MMSKKLDKNKLATMLISGVLVASAGTYAFASQYNQPEYVAPEAVSSVTSSEAVSSAVSSVIESVTPVESVQSTAESVIVPSSAPKEEISNVESTVLPAETQVPASQPEQASTSSASTESASSYVASLTPDVCYYMIVDPETGKYINARQQGYFELQAQLGGDAGKVPPDQSTACQAALAQYKAKQAAASSASTK